MLEELRTRIGNGSQDFKDFIEIMEHLNVGDYPEDLLGENPKEDIKILFCAMSDNERVLVNSVFDFEFSGRLCQNIPGEFIRLKQKQLSFWSDTFKLKS